MTDEREQNDQPGTPQGDAAQGEPSQDEQPQTEPQDSAELASLQEQLEATRAERDENYNLALRTQAELENYRRRVNREREEESRYRSLPLARDLLPVMDNLQRALDAAGKTGNIDELVQGIQMVLKQFGDALGAHAVTPIAAEGESFDPNKHDALSQVPSPNHEPMTVLQEVERGYMLHDRVLRPSKVIVSTAPPQSE